MRRAVVVWCLAVGGARLEAQASGPRWSVSTTVTMFAAHQAVAGANDLTGTWAGLAVEGQWRALGVDIGGYSGSLSGGGDARTVRLTDAALLARPNAWLTLGVAAEAVRVLDSGDTVVWRMAGPLAGITAPLGVEGLSASAEAAYFPILGVSGIDTLAHAGRLQVGIAYTLARWPVRVTLEYRRQTFSFTDPRVPEALGGLALGVHARLLAR